MLGYRVSVSIRVSITGLENVIIGPGGPTPMRGPTIVWHQI